MGARRVLSEPMPLDSFRPTERAEIERLASAPSPPPKWKEFRDANGRVYARMMSRAFYEWHMRRGRDVRSAPGREPISPSLRAAVIERDGLVCGICGGVVERGDVHIDHVRPVARGGRSMLSNLQVAHSRCNVQKRDKWEGR